MNHIHVSFLTLLTWTFVALIVGPLWRVSAMLLYDKPIGQALAFAGPGL